MEIKLKPCPFCGGAPQGVKYEYALGALGKAYKYTVLCTSCFSMSGRHPSETEAVTAWNERSGTESGMSNDQKKHIDAFKYWVQTNTENGVSTIPKSICDDIIRILDGEDGGADDGD